MADLICNDCGGKWARLEDYNAHKEYCWKDHDRVKMTRQEAIGKLQVLYEGRTANNDLFVDRLAALGLIKLENEGNSIANQIGFTYWNLREQISGDATGRDLTKIGQVFIDDLNSAGYVIIKK